MKDSEIQCTSRCLAFGTRAVPVRKAEFLVTDTESLGKFGGGRMS